MNMCFQPVNHKGMAFFVQMPQDNVNFVYKKSNKRPMSILLGQDHRSLQFVYVLKRYILGGLPFIKCSLK